MSNGGNDLFLLSLDLFSEHPSSSDSLIWHGAFGLLPSSSPYNRVTRLKFPPYTLSSVVGAIFYYIINYLIIKMSADYEYDMHDVQKLKSSYQDLLAEERKGLYLGAFGFIATFACLKRFTYFRPTST